MSTEDTVTRYSATIRVRIDFDAATSHDAHLIANRLANTIYAPTPRGANAELVSTYARVTVAPERP